MSRLLTLLIGILAFVLLSWFGLVVVPYFQLTGLQPEVNENEGTVYPIDAGGFVAEGRVVYAANGCVNCHTQVVRPGHYGADIERDWGNRQTVARDFIYESPILLGVNRVGPDLSNIGKRQPDANWHYLHLYNPRSVQPQSMMPSYSFLFEKRKVVGQRSDEALNLTGKDAPADEYEIIPKREAKALVAYLLSLDRTHKLAGVPVEKAAEETKTDAKTQPAAGGEAK